ncbi:MAG: BrnT family toxin [Synergistaceae bacterium]|nr:BrnT family toxin [Synergistaceae bacterium]
MSAAGNLKNGCLLRRALKPKKRDDWLGCAEIPAIRREHRGLTINTPHVNIIINTAQAECVMGFEWDDQKRIANIRKHHIDFNDAAAIYNGFVITSKTPQPNLTEERFLSIGLMRDIEIVVVFTKRGGNRRIISARRARKNEREKYYEESERDRH